MKINNFDEKVEREFDIRRKWDYNLIKSNICEDTPIDFIPLWIADMDFKLPDKLIEVLTMYIQNGSLGYTSLTLDFYDSIISWQKKRHGVNVKKEWINISYGTVGILHVLNQVFLEKGDYVLINTPVYEPFKNAALNNGNNIVTSPMKIENGRYYINFKDMEEKIIQYKPKIYILCNPHNPSGRVWEMNEIEKLAKICYKYGVIMVSDEVHSEMVFSNNHNSSLKLEDKYLNNLIFLTSPNKAFNLGGLKTSYSIIPNDDIREKLKKGMKKNSITSPNILGLISLITVYNECEEWLDDLVEYIYENYIYLKNYIENELKNFQLFSMESSYLAWINLEKTGKDTNWWTKELAKSGVIVENGNEFVENAEKFIRLNLGIPRKYLKEALIRIKIVYDSL